MRKFLPGELDPNIDREGLTQAPTQMWDVDTRRKCEKAFCSSDIERCLVLSNVAKATFLDYLVEFQGCLLFGSNAAHLTELPLISLSKNLIGYDNPRHLAFSSSVEAIYHAILDHHRLNARGKSQQTTVVLPFDTPNVSEKRFYYALDYRVVSDAPWRQGTVYVFRKSDFAEDYLKMPFRADSPIRPILKIAVTPQDWPLLGQVHAVDHTMQNNRQKEELNGYPYVKDALVHPFLWKKPLADAARSAIDANLAEPMGLSEVGKHIGCSPFATLRLFRSVHGQSPYEYQTHLRLAHAKLLLQQGKSIGQVASHSGFFDQAHFGRLFRRHLGITPGQYVRAQYCPIHSI